MRLHVLRTIGLSCCVPLLALACSDDVQEANSASGTADTSTTSDSDSDSSETGTASASGDGDGDGDSGDGDGDSGDGDGDPAGDGDGDSGDGDGDSGDGDGDPAGDGDGDSGDSGDGDGDSGDGDGDSGDGDGDSGDGDGDGDGDSGDGDGDGDSGDGDGDMMEFCECAENTDLIYVLSDDAELWSFDPATNQFELIADALGCPENNTFSMSVDRNGFAYVMFFNDDIYTIDVNNPNMCSDPGYDPGQMNFDKFGMGFVSNSQFDQCDKLYAHSWSGMGGFDEGQGLGRLGRMDADTLQMEEIGPINYDGGELTGTGDGRLFAFAGNPAKLVEYDKSDASVIETEQLNMSLTNAFAFAFYGGDFFMFTESDQNNSVSKVTHYDYDDSKDLTTVVVQAPMRIVGAGVSTCVPLAQ